MPSTRRYTIEEFLGTTNFSGASFSADGARILVSSDASGIYNACAIATTGGSALPLTHSTEDSIYAVSYFPADDRFLYRSDRGGNELEHLYVQTPDREVTDLTPGANLKAIFYGWAHDDRSFYFGTNERDPRYFDVYEYDVESLQRQLVFPNNDGYDFAGATPDRRHLALARMETTADSDIYLWDVAESRMHPITEHDGDINHHPAGFTPDGESMLCLTDRDSEFTYLMRYRLGPGTYEELVVAEWDVTFARLSKHGSYLAVGVNNDARTELLLHHAHTMKRLPLPSVPNAEIRAVSFSHDETRMAFYASSSKTPSDLFVSDVAGSEPICLTRSLNEAINAEDLVEGTVVRFNSYDEAEIPGILYRPADAAGDTPAPALVFVHGGPGGQSRVGYDALTQFLVNHGYLVYAINNRGSSGYGKTFFHMDDRKHGDADLDDVVECKKMLVATGYVDEGSIGVIGGSYGGYMVLAALAFRPEAFEVGVDIFGISNWYRTLQNMPVWWESARKALEQEMGDFDDEEFFRAKSPFFHAERIIKPLAVLQGANDPRVLKIESDEIVEAVRANGVPVEYVLFDDEGHGFVKRENQVRGYQAILEFLDRHLARAGRR